MRCVRTDGYKIDNMIYEKIDCKIIMLETHLLIRQKRYEMGYKNRAFNSLSFRNEKRIKENKCRTNGGILYYKTEEGEIRYALVQGRATGKWSFPKGHSNKGEDALECAKREIAEETSLEFLPNEKLCIKIGYGNYYVFELNKAELLVPRDIKEIMDTKWVSIREMEKMSVNADVSIFLKRIKENVIAP
jgi:8-oxo-dGTP pyrophosphatase MutT (NUDIX family)